jgi:hypothetical protein|tara:strand:+ start:240 stop:509 length:270 start_codon:yes stop_codon:yes gene_type:complete
MGVVKVPFDTNGGMTSAMDNTFSVRCKDLDAVLENAYETMDWFKYLADNALSVEVLEQYYDSPKFMTTHVVGFELEDKHETFYRIKYDA